MSITATRETSMSSGRVAVLMGGNSAEREVSLRSGAAVLGALERRGYDVIGIDVDTELPMRLREASVARVFNILHGRGGEDGQLQGLLAMMGIPCTGSGVLASALSMDKALSKQIWQGLGLPTPAFHLLDESTDWQQVMAELGEAVVKPVHEGSSIGMTLVDSAQALATAFSHAREFDRAVMAEKRVRGAEFSVSILHGKALPAIELRTSHDFFDYYAKYVAEDTVYICPTELSADKQAYLEQLGEQAFHALGCHCWGRVDVMQDESSGEFYLLEVNTVPGMTDHSLVPMAASHVGIDFEELVVRILEGAPQS